MRRFPSGVYGRQLLNFYPAPFRAPLRAFAALVFPWKEDQVLVCDIAGRGWCVPSGRVEPGESSEQAVIREAVEEGGAVLQGLQYIGCYQIHERADIRWADCFTARIGELIDIQAKAESHGRRFMGFDQLPDLYHLWNDLTERVFVHSLEVLRRSDDQH